MSSFSSVRFSRDGKLLMCVVEGRIHVLDSFSVWSFSFLGK